MCVVIGYRKIFTQMNFILIRIILLILYFIETFEQNICYFILLFTKPIFFKSNISRQKWVLFFFFSLCSFIDKESYGIITIDDLYSTGYLCFLKAAIGISSGRKIPLMYVTVEFVLSC